MTWPITWAPVPSAIAVKGRIESWVKTRSSETAIASSGVVSGTSMRKLAMPEPRPRQRERPIARRKPSGVAISMSSAASSRLWTRALV